MLALPVPFNTTPHVPLHVLAMLHIPSHALAIYNLPSCATFLVLIYLLIDPPATLHMLEHAHRTLHSILSHGMPCHTPHAHFGHTLAHFWRTLLNTTQFASPSCALRPLHRFAQAVPCPGWHHTQACQQAVPCLPTHVPVPVPLRLLTQVLDPGRSQPAGAAATAHRARARGARGGLCAGSTRGARYTQGTCS